MYKAGDLVLVRDCEELEMPCTIQGSDEWMPRLTKPDGSVMFLYKVVGKHKKRGNQVSVRVSDCQLTKVGD